MKTCLYGLLSVLLLFTAAIVSNIEAVQQTLNVTLDNAYLHVFVSVEALTWIRSISVVLIIVAHAMRHVQIARKKEDSPQPVPQTQEEKHLVITPELLDTLRGLLSQTTVTEEQPAPTLLLPEGDTQVNNGERVKAYLLERPTAMN